MIKAFGSYVPNVIYVKVKPEFTAFPLISDFVLLSKQQPDVQLTQILQQHKVKSSQKATRLPYPELTIYYKLILQDSNLTFSLIKALKLHPSITLVEQQPVWHKHSLPNDPFLFDQAKHLLQINMPLAWRLQPNAPNVTIALIDDGFRLSHEDLKDNIYINPNEIPNNGIDDDNNGYIDDVSGWDAADNDNNPSIPTNLTSEALDKSFYHGTHTAGIACGVGNNGVGSSSPAVNVKFIPIKGQIDRTNNQSTISYYVESIEYAVAIRADVLSMSFGSPISLDIVSALIYRAYLNGMVVVASAGNGNTATRFYPAAYETVIAVAAVDEFNKKASYSNFGTWVDIAAPGSIMSSSVQADDKYVSYSGTSMSAPLVASVAALIKAYNPRATNETIKNCLIKTATNLESLNPDTPLGGGLINAAAALTCVEPIICKSDTFAFSSQQGEPMVIQQPIGTLFYGSQNGRYQEIAARFARPKGLNSVRGVGFRLAESYSGDDKTAILIKIYSMGGISQKPEALITEQKADLSQVNSGYLYVPFTNLTKLTNDFFVGFSFVSEAPVSILAKKDSLTSVYYKNQQGAWDAIAANSHSPWIDVVIGNTDGEITYDIQLAEVTGLTVELQTTLLNNAGYYWEFSDGGGGAGNPFRRTFLEAGTYTVTLTVLNGRCGTRVIKSISVREIPISRTSLSPPDYIDIYPNPATGLVFIKNLPRQSTKVFVYDVKGQLVMIREPTDFAPCETQIVDLTPLQDGFYTFEVLETSARRRKTYKILKR